jgi:hypothetical protein
MSTSTPPTPGGAPEPEHPTPPAPSVPDGGQNNDDNDFSPLLDLLQRFPDLFEMYVLERLDPTARASLARTASAFLDVVYPRSIFPFGLPRAEMTSWGVLARVFKLVDFLGTAQRISWARANGCQWGAETCELAARRGNLVALKWLRTHACPWDIKTCYAATDGGHLQVLQWGREHDCPWDGWQCEIAATDHPETLAWVWQQLA